MTSALLDVIDRVYWGDWTGREDVATAFQVELDPAAEILYAHYQDSEYSGEAFVLFRREGRLYEVNGNHCSCYELEGQWKPEETTAGALLMVWAGGKKLHYHADERLARVCLLNRLVDLGCEAEGR